MQIQQKNKYYLTPKNIVKTINAYIIYEVANDFTNLLEKTLTDKNKKKQKENDNEYRLDVEGWNDDLNDLTFAKSFMLYAPEFKLDQPELWVLWNGDLKIDNEWYIRMTSNTKFKNYGVLTYLKNCCTVLFWNGKSMMKLKMKMVKENQSAESQKHDYKLFFQESRHYISISTFGHYAEIFDTTLMENFNMPQFIQDYYNFNGKLPPLAPFKVCYGNSNRKKLEVFASRPSETKINKFHKLMEQKFEFAKHLDGVQITNRETKITERNENNERKK